MKIFRPRAEDIFDWGGRQLEPQIRSRITVGNIVRVQAEQDPQLGWVETPYLRVADVDGDALTGVVDDPYRGADHELLNGDTISFERLDVMEIPTDWDGNEGLLPHVEYTGLVRDITGML